MNEVFFNFEREVELNRMRYAEWLAEAEEVRRLRHLERVEQSSKWNELQAAGLLLVLVVLIAMNAYG
jgi:hypothetical protein